LQYFTKPWAMTTVMFLGMSFCLPWAYWEEHKHKKQAKEALQSANGDISDPLLYGESLVSSYLLATPTIRSPRQVMQDVVGKLLSILVTSMAYFYIHG